MKQDLELNEKKVQMDHGLQLPQSPRIQRDTSIPPFYQIQLIFTELQQREKARLFQRI